MDILPKVIIIAAMIILPGTIYYLLAYRNIIYQIRRTPSYIIKALPSRGQAAVNGKAEANTLTSPITKKDCVYFNCYVQELKYLGSDNDPARITIYRNSSKEPLQISDETGKVQIDLNNANIILRADFQERVTGDVHREIRANLTELGIKIASDRGSNRSFWIHEEFISAGEPIFVLGHAGHADGNKIIYSSWNHRTIISDYSKEELLEMFSHSNQQLIVWTPVLLIIIILILLAGILVCKWPLS